MPLTSPTESFELFSGPVGSSHVTCIDTPGLPCSSRSAIAPLLASLHRVVFVVDSQADWHFALAAAEMADLWREVARAHAAAATGHAQSSASDNFAPISRKSTFFMHTPSLHIVCTKQVEAVVPPLSPPPSSDELNKDDALLGAAAAAPATHSPISRTLTPTEIAAYMHLSLYLPPSQLSPQNLHGWDCSWDATRLTGLIGSILGPLSSSDPRVDSRLHSHRRKSLPHSPGGGSMQTRLRTLAREEATAMLRPASTTPPPPPTRPFTQTRLTLEDGLQLTLPVRRSSTIERIQSNQQAVLSDEDHTASTGAQPLMSPSHVRLVYPTEHAHTSSSNTGSTHARKDRRSSRFKSGQLLNAAANPTTTVT